MKKSRGKKILKVFLSLILILLCFLSVDILFLKMNKPPLFAIPINGTRTSAKEFYGLGYKVYANDFCKGVVYYGSDYNDMLTGDPMIDYSKVIFFHGCG